ncbi:MAG: 30S ribosome-binding factor RbfA [Anaerolineae bacterium]
MPRVSRRQRRVGEQIQEELSALLQREVQDPRLAEVTITRVDMSPDLRRAEIYISTLGSQEEREIAAVAIQAAAGYFRRELARRLSLRFMPEIVFLRDDSLERGQRIIDLIQDLQEGE